ncbi:MAG: sulfide/dihydroorotate dehydrogenase-like FAD/NAD-binding protein [Erysipelotrichales bacterium]|nr:sulfide/dihydroorotate dehydrogenase-like FAD/NAD-binding protein [Erysipelotrichales bacterium]
MNNIIKKRQLNTDTYTMRIVNPQIAMHAKPGHFVIIKISEEGERIPLTISDTDDDWIEITFQAIGLSTKLLAKLSEGDVVRDLVGPLGKEKEINKQKRVLGVAGGVGVAPLYPQLKAFRQAGAKIDLIVGARNIDNLLFLERFESICHDIYLSTDDGSEGLKGTVIEVLKKLNLKVYNEIVIIGPALMMKAVVDFCKETKALLSVSLNPIMIDGTGMCGECRVSINGESRFTCIDGPDFDGRAVDFDELALRQKTFKAEEHLCQLEAEHE